MKITVISEAGHVHRAEIDGLPQTGKFRWYLLRVGYDELADVADEHITWIRGWHDNDSDEVKALLGARALGPSPNAMSLERAHTLYTMGTITFETWKANLDRWDGEFMQDLDGRVALDRADPAYERKHGQ